jgi:hypothetical protein
MVRWFSHWQICFVTFILLGSGAFGYGDLDKPVTSSDQGASRPGIASGVVGRVTDPDGRPVEGALIQPRSLVDPSPPIPEIAIVSDGDGRYTWSLFPGTYEISVSAEGYHRARKQVTIKAGQVVTVDFTLERAP